MNQNEFLTVKQVACHLGISHTTVHRLIEDGKLTARTKTPWSRTLYIRKVEVDNIKPLQEVENEN